MAWDKEVIVALVNGFAGISLAGIGWFVGVKKGKQDLAGIVKTKELDLEHQITVKNLEREWTESDKKRELHIQGVDKKIADLQSVQAQITSLTGNNVSNEQVLTKFIELFTFALSFFRDEKIIEYYKFVTEFMTKSQDLTIEKLRASLDSQLVYFRMIVTQELVFLQKERERNPSDFEWIPPDSMLTANLKTLPTPLSSKPDDSSSTTHRTISEKA